MKSQLTLRRALGLALLLAAALALPVLAQDKAAEPATEAPAPQLVAYYFHGNFRCPTCRKIEAYSAEAISGGFADEVASGKLEWRVVNTEEAGNEHFVQDFQLTTKSLVLVEYREGEVARFENLTQIWQLVGDKDRFVTYVRDATRKFIGQS